jgi:hypothetical protein
MSFRALALAVAPALTGTYAADTAHRHYDRAGEQMSRACLGSTEAH